MERQKLHVRKIDIECDYLGDDRMVVVGHLDDEVPNGFRGLHGELPPGKIHDMSLELEVRLTDFRILSARAKMPQTPVDDCREVIPAVEQLVGLQVIGGFTGEVRRRLGGVRGCAHLGSLIMAMAPAVMQGASNWMRERPLDEQLEIAAAHLVNSCLVWRENGPFVELMRAERLPKDAE